MSDPNTEVAASEPAGAVALHSHYAPELGRFVEHEHLHSGHHRHALERRADGSQLQVVVKGPGNYSPHGLPEHREVPASDQTGGAT